MNDTILLLIRLLNKIGAEGAHVLLNFFWKLFEWIRDRYEKTHLDSLSCELIVLNRLLLSNDKTSLFIMSPYPRVLSAFGVVFQEKFNYTWVNHCHEACPSHRQRHLRPA
jgi:hypothetical protein